MLSYLTINCYIKGDSALIYLLTNKAFFSILLTYALTFFTELNDDIDHFHGTYAATGKSIVGFFHSTVPFTFVHSFPVKF